MTFREEMARWEEALGVSLDDWRFHLVFADWCEENGLLERADFHRRLAMLKRAEQRQEALGACKRRVREVYRQRIVEAYARATGPEWNWYDGWDSDGSTHRGWINEKTAALLMGATLASSAPLEV